MNYRLNKYPKGDARKASKITCVTCGTDSSVYYCGTTDTFICIDCINKEQETIDEENESLEAAMDKHAEETYRRGIEK